MPNIISQGAGSAQGFGFAARSSAAVYVEDVFSTYLYTGNGGTQTITNGIELATKGGLVWIKNRTVAANHMLLDTARGPGTGTNSGQSNALATNSQSSAGGALPANSNDYLSAFTTSGFTVVASNGGTNTTRGTNRASDNYVSWTFEKQPKFFDIVTYTGNGAIRTIPHNLGSAPGCIIIKRIDGTSAWTVFHRGINNGVNAAQYVLQLDSTGVQSLSTTSFNSTFPTSTEFTLGTQGNSNLSTAQYVAYLFAHNAGGFGASGTDNIITCGNYTGTGTTNNITLGFEPQWVLVKNSSGTGTNWIIVDNMRPFDQTQTTSLVANATTADATANPTTIVPTATGFVLPTATNNVNGTNYVYIAIRRGLMKTPTSGTSVFIPSFQAGGGSVTTNFPADLSINTFDNTVSTKAITSRLTGGTLGQIDTSTEGLIAYFKFDSQTTIRDTYYGNTNNTIFWNFRRAPGFCDVLCYTGTGSNTTQTHNLGVAPELILVKSRAGAGATGWQVYSKSLAITEYLVLNTNAAKATGITRWNGLEPTASTFSIGTAAEVNTSAATYVAYLFATCPGVSKVGSYTGTATAQTIDCGFSSGARFILIKRIDTTGDWWVYDSTRGISSGLDPYIYLNTTAASVTNSNFVDTDPTGFKLTAGAPVGLNANGGTYIFLAVS